MGRESAPARVLVVEDEETVAFTLGAILTDEGYEVNEAPTADDALRLIESFDFDVALLDLRLGPDDGLGILRRLKQVSPRTVALVLTGYGSLDTAIQAMRLGASDYLLKPCDRHGAEGRDCPRTGAARLGRGAGSARSRGD